MLETTENDKAYDKLRATADKSDAAKKVLRGAGYARGGGVGRERPKTESKMAKPAAKKAGGGKISGDKPMSRPDKPSRGGSKPSGHHTRVNINVGAGQAEKEQALKTGIALGARMAGAGGGGGPRPMAGAPMQARGPAPTPAGPPMGGAPGGGAPPPPMANRGGAFKRGGKVGPKKVPGVTNVTKGGAGGAEGRLEKAAKYGAKTKK